MESLWPADQPVDLEELLRRPEWQKDAACRDNPDVVTGDFFPERGEPNAVAVATCSRCLVRVECLGDAMSDPLRQGVWGGTSAGARRRLRRGAA